MNDLKIIEKIRSFPKKIITVSDLGKILPFSQKSLPTIISRLKKRGVLNQVARGYYSAYGEIIVPENVACQIYYPSYLSLKTVLSKAGVINQISQSDIFSNTKKNLSNKNRWCFGSLSSNKKRAFFWLLFKGSKPDCLSRKSFA